MPALATDWSQELPQAPGDYLWANIWGCGCCVHHCDFCYVRYLEDSPSPDTDMVYEGKDGRKLGLAWGYGGNPLVEGRVPSNVHFMHVELPEKK